MSTQIVPEISRQLAQAYDTTQRELAKDPAMTGQVWAEALQQLQDFDPGEATREQFVQAQASVSILEQVLTSVPYRLGMFDGNK